MEDDNELGERLNKHVNKHVNLLEGLPKSEALTVAIGTLMLVLDSITSTQEQFYREVASVKKAIDMFPINKPKRN